MHCGEIVFFYFILVINSRENSASQWKKIKQLCKDFNLFPSIPPSTDPYQLRTQRISTLLFILLLIDCTIILLSYVSLQEIPRTIHINSPTLEQYSQLRSSHPQTLSCPCSKVFINYEQFISIKYTLHQVCSSVFVTDSWFNYLASNYEKAFFVDDFRRLGPLAFQGLRAFCQLVNSTIDNSVKQLYSSQYVSVIVIPMELFTSQIESLVDQFRSSTANSFQLTLALILHTTQTNALYSKQQTHFWLKKIDSDAVGESATYGDCNCFTSTMCSDQVGIMSDSSDEIIFVIPGFRKGCFVIEALLQSDLRCFYNQSCINQLKTHLSSKFAVNVKALDKSLLIQYLPNSTIQELVDRLMIEKWNVTQMYDQYYNACQPVECVYKIETRKDVIYIVTTLLGVIGGLTAVLGFIIPRLVKLIFYCFQKWKTRVDSQVETVQT